MKRFVALVSAMCMLIGFSAPVYATGLYSEDTIPQRSFTEVTLNDLNGMTVSQLNSYIHSVATYSSTASVSNDGVDMSGAIRLAWYAAGRIMELSGYPCTGILIKKSSLGASCSETNGLFANKIKQTAKYQNWKNNYTPSSPTSLSFENSDNPDLYLSLHAVNINLTGSSNSARIIITDTYDFSRAAQIRNVMVKFVNDTAWLCQFNGWLSVISVSISIPV